MTRSRVFTITLSLLLMFLTVFCSVSVPGVAPEPTKTKPGEVIEPTQVDAPTEAEVIPSESSEATKKVPTKAPTAAKPTTKPLPTDTEAPLVTEPPAATSINAAWIGSFGYGINSIDESGWHTFTEDDSGLAGNQIYDIAICPDNRAWIASGLGLSVTDGTSWEGFKESLGYKSPSGVACDDKGGVWVSYYEGAAYYDGTTWTTHEATNFGTGKYVKSVADIAVAPDGTPWLVTSNSVATYDGSAWTYYEKDKGFAKEFYFNRIIVDGKGLVWVSYTSGVWMFDGKTWKNFEASNIFQVQSMALDKDGNLWVGTWSKGISKYTGKGWVTYNRANSGLSSNKVRALAGDAQGRMWIGTEYGVDIFDGKNWTAYQMHTSDLTDNEIYALGVSGDGPVLPDKVDKGTGSISGKIMNGTEPVVGVLVEVCTEYIGMMYTGSTPCSDNPYTKSVKTGADGSFVFTDLPVGRYAIAFQGPDKKWMRMTGSFGLSDAKVLVIAGEETKLDAIDISKKK